MTHAHRIEHLNEGEVLYIAIDPDGVWARSEFPDPLITVDYDADDNVIGISPAGPRVSHTLHVYEEWLRDEQPDPQKLVARLGESRKPAAV